MSNEPERLRPCNAPALALCPRFMPDNRPRRAKSRGKRLHERLAVCLQSGEPETYLATVPKSYAMQVRFGYEFTRDLNVRGIEDTITIFSNGNGGTVDCWGWDQYGDLHVLDFKSGRPRDYSVQLKLYAHGLMARLGLLQARLHEVYLDRCSVTSYDASHADTAILAASLEDRWERRAQLAPVACCYCVWCGVKDCEARNAA